MRVLDSEGQLTELLWDDGNLTGHDSFHVDGNSLPDGGSSLSNFTHVASGDENILYGLSEDGVGEFASEGSWWVDGQESQWKFVDYI